MNHSKEVYIIGGPNGAGKTTFVRDFLPDYIKINNLINVIFFLDSIKEGRNNGQEKY